MKKVPKKEISCEEAELIILGGGISGMTAAAIAARLQSSDVQREVGRIVLIDEFSELGGNHKDFKFGGYSFDIGSFFFQRSSPFFAHFPGLQDIYENQQTGSYSIARITPSLEVGRYPIDPKRDVLGKGFLDVVKFGLSLTYSRLFHSQKGSAADYAKYWIGGRLFRSSGLHAYMRKFYNLDPELIDGEFAQKRMNWIRENGSFANIMRQVSGALFSQKRAPDIPKVKQLVRPKSGFQTIYRAAQKFLEDDGVEILLGNLIKSVKKDSEAEFTITMENGFKIKAKRILSTIPLSRILELTGKFRDPLIETTNLMTLFFSFSGNRGFSANVLYNFAETGRWKRLTMHSDFYGNELGREYFSVEVVVDKDESSEIDLLETDFRNLVSTVGLFKGDLILEGHAYTPSAYPKYQIGSTLAAENALNDLEAYGITSFGRQGGFDYQPIAVVSVKKAEQVLAG